MARVTVEDCLKNVDNRFGLVHLTSSRVRQLIDGSKRLVYCDNKDIVCALREIAASYVVPQEVTPVIEDEAALKIEIPDFN